MKVFFYFDLINETNILDITIEIYWDPNVKDASDLYGRVKEQNKNVILFWFSTF